MKSIKILTIVIVIFLASLPVFSQEAAGEGGSSVISNDQGSRVTEDKPATVKDNNAEAELSGTVNKKVSEDTTAGGSSVKAVKKRTTPPVIQEEQVSAEEENTPGEDFLLSINEGNFKYKRIPDIKLADRTPAMTEQNMQNINSESDNQNNSDDSSGNGFFGLSKNAADIVAKGGILLLILAVFILYRLRSRGTGRRGSSTRVMKSYRK